MHDDLGDMMRRRAQEATALLPGAEIGVVTSYDPNTGTAKVQIMPDGGETGWLQVAMPFNGMVAPPTIGQQCNVSPIGHAADSGMILGAVFSDTSRPPQSPNGPVLSGQFLVVDAAGSLVFMDGSGNLVIRNRAGAVVTVAAAGTLTMADPSGSSFALSNDGTVAIVGHLAVSGDVVATGNISDLSGAHGTVGAMRAVYDPHTHIDSRGGTTSAPTPQTA